MLGNLASFFFFFLLAAVIPSECQIVWIQIRPDIVEPDPFVCFDALCPSQLFLKSCRDNFLSPWDELVLTSG